MAQDKVTVDEPLISTDVDSLIRTLAERKRVPLNELRQLCRIDKKTMDKWIAVLEDEGYISVEYGLRGTNVLWRGVPTPSVEEAPRSDVVTGRITSDSARAEEKPAEEEFTALPRPRPVSREQPPGPDEPAESYEIVEEAHEDSVDAEAKEDAPEAADDEAQKRELNEEFSAEVPLEDEPDPEFLLSEYLARKKGGPAANIDSIKSSILTSLESEERVAKKADKPAYGSDDDSDAGSDADGTEDGAASEEVSEDEPEEVPVRRAVAHAPAKREEKEDENDDDTGSGEEEAEAPAETLRPTSRERPASADVRELMGSYLDEINKEKSRIEALKKEREALYREKFATMEGKLQADIVVLTEKIIEKESRIAQLRERVLELPDKVDELGRLQEQMDNLKREGREALQRTRAKADEYIAAIADSRAQVGERVAEVSAALDVQSTRMKELEKLSSMLEGRSAKLKTALDESRTQLDELSGAMASLMDDLQQVEQAKAEISATSDSIKSTVASHGEELQSLEQELEGIERMEHWVQEYVRDYEQKIEDVEKYVSRSDEELAELKEAAESLYMKKYLSELESMTDAYEGELHDAVTREKEIDTQIADSRTRIAELVGESQEMIKKLRSESGSTEKDFYILAAKAKARNARTKNLVDEKQQERAKLGDESSRTRKTKSSGAKPLKKKATAKSKARKKRK